MEIDFAVVLSAPSASLQTGAAYRVAFVVMFEMIAELEVAADAGCGTSHDCVARGGVEAGRLEPHSGPLRFYAHSHDQWGLVLSKDGTDFRPGPLGAGSSPLRILCTARVVAIS